MVTHSVTSQRACIAAKRTCTLNSSLLMRPHVIRDAFSVGPRHHLLLLGRPPHSPQQTPPTIPHTTP